MFSDLASCLSSSPSRVFLPPTSPHTSPLRTATTPKRPFQGTPSRHPSQVYQLFCLSEYSNGPTTFVSRQDKLVCKFYLFWEPELQVSALATHRNVGRSFHLTQLKRSSLHLEKRLVSQKILEHEISLQALKERMPDIEKNISNTTLAVGNLHCYMDQVGVPVLDMSENVATSIIFFEVTLTPFHVAPRFDSLDRTPT